MKSKVAILAVFVIAAAIIVLFARSKKESPNPVAAPGAATPVTAPAGDKVEISVIYSTEKKEWMDAAVAAFAGEHPEITVKLIGKGSLEAAAAIAEGQDRPTLWSPADSMVLALAASDYRTRTQAALYDESDPPQPLVLTPLVFAIWQDRAEVLQKASGGAITWKAIHKAVTANQGWPAIGGQAKWGFVKLGHTDPTRSNSGLQALYLMTLEYFGKSRLEIDDLLKPDYQTFVKEVEKGVSRFEVSTGTFMTDMIRFGPSKYDIAVVYENLAISQLENAQGRWGSLKVYYPSVTLWSDHPIALLTGDWVSPAQAAAGRQFIAFLRSRPIQERALAYGFRPADTSVPVKTADAANPFTRLAPYGIAIEVPTAAEPPEGPIVKNLMMMWSRVVKK